MKFTDYEASHITPQMTLLKKFNEVLKYLRGGKFQPLFLHKITYSQNPLGKIYLVNTNPDNLTNNLEGLVEQAQEAICFKIVNESTSEIFNVLNFSYNAQVGWAFATIVSGTTLSSKTIVSISNDEVSEI